MSDNREEYCKKLIVAQKKKKQFTSLIKMFGNFCFVTTDYYFLYFVTKSECWKWIVFLALKKVLESQVLKINVLEYHCFKSIFFFFHTCIHQIYIYTRTP